MKYSPGVVVSFVAFNHRGQEQEIEIFNAPDIALEIKELLDSLVTRVMNLFVPSING